MTLRHRVLSLSASGYTSACLAVLTFLLVGWLSERVPKAWEQVMLGDRGQSVISLSLAVSLAGFVLVYRWTAAREATANEVRWFVGALGSSVIVGSTGMLAFAFAHEVFPRRWFSHGGDWDFDPLLEMVAFGLVCALTGFWPVYRRALGRPASSTTCRPEK